MKILVISPKNVYAAIRLEQEARIKNQELRIMDMGNLIACDFKIDVKSFDVLYVRNPYSNNQAKFLPQVVDLAKQFKAQGKKVVDSIIADGILAEGKWADYQKLESAGLPIPRTESLVTCNLLLVTSPLILKWIYGFKGKHTFLVQNQLDLDKVLQKYPKEELVVQEFIPAEYEYKVITVGYKALPIILRFDINNQTKRPDFDKYLVIQTPTTPSRSAGHPSFTGGEAPQLSKDVLRLARHSFSGGGSISSFSKEEYPAKRGEVVGVNKTRELIHLAEQSSRLLGRELSKIDILESKGKFYILEVNRFPGLDSFEKLTGYNVAREFIKYLAEQP